MKIITTLLLLICISTVSYGQNENPDSNKPFIEVVGTATKEIVPDKILISISLLEKSVNNKSLTIQQQEDRLMDVLKRLNIDKSKLKLSDISSEIQAYKKKDNGVQLTKEYILELAHSTEVSNLFKELNKEDIKEFSVLRTENSEIDKFRREVRITAIKTAKEKAEYLLTAIGEQLGKPLEIREITQAPYFGNSPVSNVSLRLEKVDNILENNFKTITVEFSYYIKYSIK